MAYQLIDTHLHWVDFLQHSDGLEALLQKMDEAGIEKAVIFGLPVKKKWSVHEPRRPSYYLDGYSTCFYYTLTDELLAQAYESLSKPQQQRLALLLCSFNPTDLSSLDYVKMMCEKHSVWKGVGELLLRHDDLSVMTNDELPRVNHEALTPIFDFCEARSWPVLVHHNCSSVGFEHAFMYTNELEAVLKRHPRLTLVWAHCGASRRTMNGHYHEMMEDMLSRYANLYADISWVVYDQEICTEGEPKDAWLALFNRFPDRFTIGSDVFGHFDELKEKLTRYQRLLDQLPTLTAEKLAWQNAEKLWFSD